MRRMVEQDEVAPRAPARDDPVVHDTVLHRPIPARLLGPDSTALIGLFAPVCTFGAIAIAAEGEDPVALPLSWGIVAVVSWVVAVRNWRMRTTLTAAGIVMQGWWRRHRVRWDEIASIEFGMIGWGYGGAIVHRHDGTHLALTPGIQCLHRNRLRQARPLVAAARAHGIPVRVAREAKWMWRRSGIAVGGPTDHTANP